MTGIQLLIGVIGLIASVFAWWVKAHNDEQAKKDALKKEGSDAVANNDASGINNVFDKLRK